MTDHKAYIDALKHRLHELEKEVNQLKTEVRRTLEAIEEKEKQVEYIGKLLEAEGESPAGRRYEQVATMSLSDIAYDVLAKHASQEPIYYRELVDEIMAHGKAVPGKDPGANLIAHMSRDERFVRTGRGMYGLAEWDLESAKKPRRRTKKK